MKRAMTFAGRNFKEMLRDPLCYIFCVAMPLALLFVMHFAFYDAQNTFWFSVEILTPGINCFAYAFVMLYLALLVSQDRATSFLTRLYTSPMRPAEFIIGYMLPGFAIGMVQAVLCYLCATVISIAENGSLSFAAAGIPEAILLSLPALLIYASIGILFGAAFSDKAAPGLCSAIITASAFLSGAWMLVDESSALGIVCRILPFYPTVKLGRFALAGWETLRIGQTVTQTGLAITTEQATFATCWSHLLVVIAWALVLFPLAILVFRKRTRRDAK